MMSPKLISRFWVLCFEIAVCLIIGAVAADVLAADVTLAWDPNSESDLAGYRLHYGTASRNYTQRVDAGNVTQYSINNLSAGQTYYFAATAYNAGGNESGYSAEVSHTIPAANQAPTVNAGADQTVNAGASVTLSGTGSDPDNGVASWQWRQTAGTSVSLSGATTQQGRFTAPAISTGSLSLIFEFRATDAAGLSATDTCTVTVLSADLDGDGVPNNQDAFPNNPAEWQNSDGDEIGDNADPDDNTGGVTATGEHEATHDLIAFFRPYTGEWFLDLNANRKWDGSGTDGLSKFGNNGDLPVMGDWNRDGVAEIGVFRPSTGEWLLDLNGNDKLDGRTADGYYKFGAKGDRPIAGAWKNDGIAKIGVFRPSTGEWLLDLNGNRRWDGSSVDGLCRFGKSGDLPVAGDWNNDGVTDIGVFRPSTGKWLLDLNGNDKWDGSGIDALYPFGRKGDLPVTGRW